MKGPLQTILVPVINELPHTALAYAEMLSAAYAKPISLLCLDATLVEELKPLNYPIIHSGLGLTVGINKAIDEQDAVMVVFENTGKWRLLQQQLRACRKLRIPYVFIPKGMEVQLPNKVALPMSFLIEDREKATWGRSLHRYFKSQFTILKPKDKGTRAGKNVVHVERLFDTLDICYTTLVGKKSSFKNDKEVFSLLSDWANLVIVTASREYGLDDQFLGPKELHILRKSTLPIMMLNPRDDLYILCGD
jgi:hypothetical protein